VSTFESRIFSSREDFRSNLSFYISALCNRMDPTLEQWKELSETIKKQNLITLFDCAYQGFASGDAAQDAAAVRMFVEDGHLISMVQSFSKNFGLYGQRVGALSVVGSDPDEAKRVVSQMKTVIRPMYSNPPRHGSRLVTTILEDPDLTKEFLGECKGMADRIHTMRGALHGALESAGSTKNWDHITRQIGMFAYSGLGKEQVMEMREKHHVYCTADGRISMAVSWAVIINVQLSFLLLISCSVSCCRVLHLEMLITLQTPFTTFPSRALTDIEIYVCFI
jgi:aspartate/tyrosine/aromatic aminotransferase